VIFIIPELDGYGVFESLNENAKTASIPFIFLTAKSGNANRRKGIYMGADDYLIKPFEEEELLDAVKCRLKKNIFLKKEYSKSIEGVSEFLNEASVYLKLE
jgi:DNA-binding response OmpR family regulator